MTGKEARNEWYASKLSFPALVRQSDHFVVPLLSLRLEIVTPGQEADPRGFASAAAPGAGSLSIRFLHSLGNGPIVIVPLPSFRWEMKKLTVVLLMLMVAGLGVLSAQDLFSAIERGSPQLVRQAIRKSGVDIDTPNSWGTTPLIYAAMMHDDLEIVRILLEAGADVNAVDSGGYTALMEAVLNSNTPMVSLLLAHGADVHSRDSLGMTALMHAAQTSPFAQIIRNLVDAGANPDGRSHDGRTPLMYAAGNNANPAIVEALLDSPVDVDARAASGRTALSFASELSFSPEVVKLLVEAGADMEIRDYELGRTPLFWAVKNSPDMLALLVSLGADVRTTDNAGDTILHRIL